jgi:hypothetical protein
MQSADEYLKKTESAVRKLFEGVESYIAILKADPMPGFVTSYTDDSDLQDQYEAWANKNRNLIAASMQVQRNFIAESFAQATLCGSILQVAAKALECYSDNTEVPAEWALHIKPDSKAAPFCVGRLVRGVPVGLVIYAARNQHTHFDDSALREPNLSVFERLATNHGYSSSEPFRDPAFDLGNPGVTSLASNVTALVGWRSYDAYERDMRKLLNV